MKLIEKIAKAHSGTLSTKRVSNSMLSGCHTYSNGYLPFIELPNISSAIAFYEQVMAETSTHSDQDHQPAILSISGLSVSGDSGAQRPSLGIIGGMGPAATLLLLKIVSDYRYSSLVVAMVPYIADRTQALLTKDPNLTENILAVFKGSEELLSAMGCDHIVIPCNTAHAFVYQMSGKLVHMIKVTAEKLHSLGVKQVVSFATAGTNSTGVYTKVVQKITEGEVQVITPEQEQQTQMMAIIYDEVKAKGVTDTAVENFCNLIGFYLTVLSKTSEDTKLHIGLFCTEFPLVAFDPRTERVLKDMKIEIPDGKGVSAHELVEFYDPMRLVVEAIFKNS